MHQNIQWIRIKVFRLNICEHIGGLSPTIRGLFLFSRTALRCIGLVKPSSCWQIQLQTSSPHTLATKPDVDGGVNKIWSVTEREGLSKPNWRCWWVARVHQDGVGRTGPVHCRYFDAEVKLWRTRLRACAKAKGTTLSTSCLIRDGVELVIHCYSFCQYCDSKVRNFWLCVSQRILINIWLQFHKIQLFTMKVIQKQLGWFASYGPPCINCISVVLTSRSCCRNFRACWHLVNVYSRKAQRRVAWKSNSEN